jgi:hypothetical protein
VFEEPRTGHDAGYIGIWEKGSTRRIGSPAIYTSAALSPNGEHVAALAQVGQNFDPELHVIRVRDGREVIFPLADSSNPPEWAPDSSSVALTGGVVLLVSPDGDVLVRGHARPSESGVATISVYDGWSPDSRRFAYVTGDTHVVILNVSSASATEVPLADLAKEYDRSNLYVVVWYWESQTSFVVAKGVDGETKDDVPALSVNATLDPPRAKLADFPGRPPVGFTNIRDQIEAEYGEGNIPSIERSADGSVYYFRLHGDTKVILRDVNSGETAEIALDEGGPLDVYVAPN